MSIGKCHSVTASLLKSRAKREGRQKQKTVPALFYSTVFTVKGRRRASWTQLCDWLEQPLGVDPALWGRERGRGRNVSGRRERKKGWCERERERGEEESMERGSRGTNDFTSSCGTQREGNSGREMDGCRNEGSGKRPVGLCWCGVRDWVMAEWD